ncbi:uncharacterized protein Z520_06582 [Fonsecaea multimorphosa CBS 102226]|uniref:gamma-glutamylcyclotransferase n=1 Tax=Fonsecaea multimorphosa CBS 102226 TaxID=1442371 RepID=A0A0D2K3N8_9EURO|nr:uncharacterized protein Z520_06582 [Fonsecaea multimorphosa CBS 102226]KIX97804.1 hypothetical protein Z520_06582 [Fonsecaea multimorphosa CBS 102226]OAL23824.1 hypothetical protein AYO22_06143 [Fonsecaea multimorphosa]
MESSCSGQALGSLQLWIDSLRFSTTSQRTRSAECIPTTSQARQQQSLADRTSAQLPSINKTTATGHGDEETVLYLGYGSNLSAETFRGKRGIRPVSQVNVVVPSLSLTFDLPGIPYSEPCFGNVRLREVTPQRDGDSAASKDYHKDRWSKGLVGVVYEVTKSDFVHIIATEGGGAGYQDVLVDCYALSGDPMEDVPLMPSGQPFKAHTLFAPEKLSRRPDPSYAQPSPRYLKLITDGAEEHGLPLEYQAFLHQIRTFHMTTTKQRLGSFIFLSVWSPFFLFFVGGAAAIFLRPDGTYPEWFAKFLNAMFAACWASYDRFFKDMFGDGERTIKEKDEDDDDDIGYRRISSVMDEKDPLVERVQHKYGTVTAVERIV